MTKEEITEIIIKAQKGDQQAFTQLMNAYRNSVLIFIKNMISNKEDAEDILQETFYKIFSSIERFDVRYSFYKWSIKIASNTCIDFLRKKKLPTVSIQQRSNQDENEYEINIVDHFADPDLMLKQRETRKKLENEFNLLPESYREIMILRFFDQLSYDQIAEKLLIPQGTVKTRIFRAREILKEKFSGLF